MRYLFLILLVSLATSNDLLLPFGYFSDNNTLYLLDAVSPEERSFVEAQLGCHIECSQNCINSFDGKHLAKCVNLCGCQDLLSTTQLDQDMNLMEFDEIELTTLEGDVTTYKLKQRSGTEVHYQDFQNGSKRFYYDVKRTPGIDFEADVSEQNFGRKSAKFVVWKSNNWRNDGYAKYERVSLGKKVTETTNVNIPNRNYQAKESRTTTYNRLGNTSNVHVKEAFRSNSGTVKFDADLTKISQYNGNEDYNIGINIHNKPSKPRNYRKTPYAQGGWYETDSGFLVTLQEVTLDEVQYVQSELGCDLHCNSRCLNNFQDKQVATCIELCGCIDLVQVQDLLSSFASQNVMKDAINTDLQVEYLPDQRKFNPAGTLVVDDPATVDVDFKLRHDTVTTPNGVHNAVSWNSSDTSSNGSIVEDIVAEQPVYTEYGKTPFKLTEKFDINVGSHTFSDENQTEIRERRHVTDVEYEESASLDGRPVYDLDHTQVSEFNYNRGYLAFGGHFDINAVEIPTIENYQEKCQEICEGDDTCLRDCFKGYGPSEQIEETSVLNWMANGILVVGTLFGLVLAVKAYMTPKKRTKKYYDDELMAPYHSLQSV